MLCFWKCKTWQHSDAGTFRLLLEQNNLTVKSLIGLKDLELHSVFFKTFLHKGTFSECWLHDVSGHVPYINPSLYFIALETLFLRNDMLANIPHITWLYWPPSVPLGLYILKTQEITSNLPNILVLVILHLKGKGLTILFFLLLEQWCHTLPDCFFIVILYFKNMQLSWYYCQDGFTFLYCLNKYMF